MTAPGRSLDTMQGVTGPVAAAALAAEALRTVNHLTMGAPSSGVPGWEEVGDIYRLLGHGEHPSSGASGHHTSDVTPTRGSPDPS